VIHPGADRTDGQIRLAILDDNPFVREPDGTVRPQAALFHRFAAAVVAVGGLPPASYLAPIRDLDDGARSSPHAPVDAAHLRMIATEPFDGIAGYLRHGPSMARRNWPIIRDTIGAADVLWIKAPASNAALAGIAAHRGGVPRFTWVAGSVRDVVAGSGATGLRRVAASAAAIAYDGLTRFLERTGPSIRLGPELFTSLVTDDEVATTRGAVARDTTDGFRVAWAGRMAPDKGVIDLLRAVERLTADGHAIHLTLIGDGPARPEVEAVIATSGLADRIESVGFVGDRASYMAALRSADLFVLPSHAEGMPKVIVEAMAAGLPVIATAVGTVPALLADGRLGRIVPVGDPAALAATIADLQAHPEARARLRDAGLAFAADHTLEAQATRLLGWLAIRFPDLPWRAT